MDYVNKRLDILTRHDEIRILRLLEMLQFTIVYVILTMHLACYVDKMFPALDKTKSYIRLLLEIIVHFTTLAIFIFYIQKIAKLIPPVGFFYPKYKIGTTSQYNGGAIIGIVLIGAQKNLLEKVKYFMWHRVVS